MDNKENARLLLKWADCNVDDQSKIQTALRKGAFALRRIPRLEAIEKAAREVIEVKKRGLELGPNYQKTMDAARAALAAALDAK